MKVLVKRVRVGAGGLKEAMFNYVDNVWLLEITFLLRNVSMDVINPTPAAAPFCSYLL